MEHCRCLHCCCLSTLIFVSIGIAALAALFVYKNKDFDPQPYSLPAPPKLVDGLAPNNLLRNARLIVKGEISGPESLLVEGDTIYTGTWDGKIMKIVDGRIMDTIHLAKHQENCGHYDTEPLCGRPLGIRRLNAKELVVADSYLGVFTVDFEAQGKRWQRIFDSNTTVSAKEPRVAFLNDLDVFNEDTIFFTDSSSKWDRRNFLHVILEQQPNGRVFKLSKTSGGKWKAEVVLHGLHFANGLQIHADRQSLLVSECSMAKITRFYFDGPKKGKHEVFAENLPGFPDNIRYSTSSKTYFVALAGVRHADGLSLADTLGPLPWVRQLLRLVPDRFLAPLFTLVKPKHGLVAELDGSGKLVQTMQDPGGAVIPDASQATPTADGKHIYVGSFHSDFIAEIPIKGRR